MTSLAEHVSPDCLASFAPFSLLSKEQLILLSHRTVIRQALPGEILSPWGDERAEDLFLISGKVEIQEPSLELSFLQASDDRSRYSLLYNRPSLNQITCETDVTYFAVDAELIQLMQTDNNPATSPMARVLANENTHPLVKRFYQSLLENQISLPVLPGITHKISQMIAEDRLDVKHMATLISTDATLSARILRLANSSFYRGQDSVRKLTDALVRLGTDLTYQLILAFALSEQKQEKQSSWMNKRLVRNWKASIQLAAFCYVLAKKCTHIPPEEALLAGLLHNIGELPLIQFAEHYPELTKDPDYLDQIMQEARGQAGAMILHSWNLPSTLVTAVQHVDNWFYEPSNPEPSLTDILILARLHSIAMTDRAPLTPSISQVPSYEKIAPGPLTHQQRLELLEDAREQISEIRSLFSR